MTTALRAMTPADITRIRWVSDPRISPDGRRVAFVVTVLSEERDEYLSNIWVVDTAGGEPRRFTTGPGRDTAPALVARRGLGGLPVRARGQGQTAAPRDARRWRGARPSDGPPARRLGAGVGAGQRAPRLRLAGGPGPRRGAGEVEAGPHHQFREVPLQRRGVHLRPAASRLRGRARGRDPEADHRGRLCPRRAGLVARRPPHRLHRRPPRGARRGRCRRPVGGRGGRRPAAPPHEHLGAGERAGLRPGWTDGGVRRAARAQRFRPQPPALRDFAGWRRRAEPERRARSLDRGARRYLGVLVSGWSVDSVRGRGRGPRRRPSGRRRRGARLRSPCWMASGW